MTKYQKLINMAHRLIQQQNLPWELGSELTSQNIHQASEIIRVYSTHCKIAGDVTLTKLNEINSWLEQHCTGGYAYEKNGSLFYFEFTEDATAFVLIWS